MECAFTIFGTLRRHRCSLRECRSRPSQDDWVMRMPPTTLNVYAHALESSDAEAAHLIGSILNDHGDL